MKWSDVMKLIAIGNQVDINMGVMFMYKELKKYVIRQMISPSFS